MESAVDDTSGEGRLVNYRQHTDNSVRVVTIAHLRTGQAIDITYTAEYFCFLAYVTTFLPFVQNADSLASQANSSCVATWVGVWRTPPRRPSREKSRSHSK